MEIAKPIEFDIKEADRAWAEKLVDMTYKQFSEVDGCGSNKEIHSKGVEKAFDSIEKGDTSLCQYFVATTEDGNVFKNVIIDWKNILLLIL